ncbi:MAG: hypothetical protein ACRDHM_01560 [Actinomycetota bacterium]
MPQHTHSHAGGPEHEHEGAAPGHSHDAAAAPAPPPPTTTAAVDVGPTAGGLSARIVLTLLGAAGMVVGAFLNWFNVPNSEDIPAGVDLGTPGIEWGWSVLYSTETDPFGASFFESIGFVAIVLGLVAVLGLALRTGWLTRLAGVLAIVVVVLYAITLYRVPDQDLSIGQIGLGAWAVAAGGLVVLIAGFLGSQRVVSANVPAAPTP